MSALGDKVRGLIKRAWEANDERGSSGMLDFLLPALDALAKELDATPAPAPVAPDAVAPERTGQEERAAVVAWLRMDEKRCYEIAEKCRKGVEGYKRGSADEWDAEGDDRCDLAAYIERGLHIPPSTESKEPGHGRS